MPATSSVQSAFDRLTKLAVSKEMCTADIHRKLEQLGMDEASIETVIKRLVKEDFVNDARYAECFVRDQLKLNGWGKLKIYNALETKGFDQYIIATAFATIGIPEYKSTLKMILARQKKKVNETDPEAIKQNLIRFAINRGFEENLVFECVEWLMESIDQ